MAFTIAIDGPAAAGKGTISKAVAAHFGFGHLDTGLLYRAVGAKMLDGDDPVTAAEALDVSDLDREDLRTPEASSLKSCGDCRSARRTGGFSACFCPQVGRRGDGRARHRHRDLPRS